MHVVVRDLRKFEPLDGDPEPTVLARPGAARTLLTDTDVAD